MEEREYILSVISYFDVFHYPVDIEEIQQFLKIDLSLNELSLHLQKLVAINAIFLLREKYYSLQSDKTLVDKRVESNQRAVKMFHLALKNGRLISKFPFTRSVCLSGSISKGVMHHDSDIDYFIITAKNRLWICRAFLVLYKRIFLMNSRKKFCINYFVSESDLKIKEENLFTATEIKTLTPVYGAPVFEEFIERNSWARTYILNYNQNDKTHISTLKKPFLIKALEGLLNFNIFNGLERRIHNYFIARNNKKYSNYSDNPHFELMFRSTNGQAKIHKLDHQSLVLMKYKNKMNQLIDSNKIDSRVC